jgi:hypothetical protein
MTRSIDSLLADLIAQATMDQDQGREEMSPKAVFLRDQITQRFADLERKVADADQDRPVEAQVRPVPGGQDPPDQERGEDLPALRRVAADPGAAGDAAPRRHHIMTGAAMLVTPTDDPTDAERFFLAQWCLWSCGPCRVQGGGRSTEERDQQVTDHVASR